MGFAAEVDKPMLESGALPDTREACTCCTGVLEPDPEPRHLLWTHQDAILPPALQTDLLPCSQRAASCLRCAHVAQSFIFARHANHDTGLAPHFTCTGLVAYSRWCCIFLPSQGQKKRKNKQTPCCRLFAAKSLLLQCVQLVDLIFCLRMADVSLPLHRSDSNACTTKADRSCMDATMHAVTGQARHTPMRHPSCSLSCTYVTESINTHLPLGAFGQFCGGLFHESLLLACGSSSSSSSSKH